MSLLNLLSAFCLVGSIAAAVIWFYRRTTAAYEAGQQELKQYEINPHIEINDTPTLARASQLGVLFVPFVNQLIAKNRFGIKDVLSRWQRDLIRAGWSNTITDTQLMSASMVAAVALGLTVAVLFLLWGAGLLGGVIIGFPLGALGGFWLPSFLVKGQAKDRLALIEKRLPFAIEFMLLAMEASAAFPGAMSVYCEQLKDDPLADEFRIVLREIEDGLGVEASLTRMVKRLDLESVASFVLAVTTGIETGQPIKAVLKVQADAARQRRYKAAEEVAKTAGTRAIFPLFLVMIAVLLLLVVPMLMKVTTAGMF